MWKYLEVFPELEAIISIADTINIRNALQI